jgi:hypothetical protein
VLLARRYQEKERGGTSSGENSLLERISAPAEGLNAGHGSWPGQVPRISIPESSFFPYRLEQRTKRSAHLVLQMRSQVLDERLEETFRDLVPGQTP